MIDDDHQAMNDRREQTQADAVEVVQHNLQDAIKSEVERRKKSDRERRMWRLLAIVVICCNVFTVLYFRSYIAEGRKITTNTNHLVAEIDDLLGPEGRAASASATQKSIDNLVDQIQQGNVVLCASIIRGLESNGVLAPGTASNSVIP